MSKYADYFGMPPATPVTGGLFNQPEEPDWLAQYDPSKAAWEAPVRTPIPSMPAHPATGKPLLSNPDGSFSSELTITIPGWGDDADK